MIHPNRHYLPIALGRGRELVQPVRGDDSYVRSGYIRTLAEIENDYNVTRACARAGAPG